MIYGQDNIKISGARIIDPQNKLDKTTDLFIAAGKIVAIGNPPDGFNADINIEGQDQILLPGLIDLAARLREPGEEHMATIDTESRAAAAGGVSQICCPPDTDPIIDTPAVAELIHSRAEAAARVKIHPIAAITHRLRGETLSEMYALKQIACVAVSNAYKPMNDTEVLRRAMEYAANTELPVMLFCEDSYLRNQGTAHEGFVSMRLGLPGIPDTAETIAVSRALLLAEHTGARVHFCRLSSRKSVDLIRSGKASGLAVTADVSIQHLHLTEDDLNNYNAYCHLRPPLRTHADRDALLAGLNDGTIDAICSDHQPHNEDAKALPFSQTESGASSIELLLPLTLKLVEEGKLDLGRAVESISSHAAACLDLPGGKLDIGDDADCCLVNTNSPWQIDRSRLVSAGKNTPFHDWPLSAKLTLALLNGRIVYQAS